jgi:pimeloyl-ACP methyl ester carboxylesterase
MAGHPAESGAVRSGRAGDPPAEAIVYVGGLGAGRYLEVGHVAELLRWEMSQRAGDRTARFTVRPTSVAAETVHRIERTDAGGTAGIVDVYAYQPQAVLDGEPEPAAALRRVATLALSVLAGILVWSTAAARSGRRTKSLPQMLQLVLCLLILMGLGAYFLTAVYALGDAVRLAVGSSSTATGITWPQWAVLTGSVGGLLAPNLRARLAESAELYQRVMRYIWTASGRNRLSGQLQALLNRVNERPEIRAIHVVGFSFGALVALDTLLPTSDRPAPIQQIRSLVTIGCPFELLQMLSPAYGRGRTPATPQPPNWINIYQPIDVLASTFGDANAGRTTPAGLLLADGTCHTPNRNIAWNTEFTLSAANFLMLPSMSAHGQYWDGPGSRSALGTVVDALYADTPTLR